MEKSKSKLTGVLVAGGILIFVLVAIIGWGVSIYNGLIAESATVDNAWAQIDNNLQRRSDLIPNLVNTVKGYAAHEEELFTEIAAARATLSGASTPETSLAADNQLSAGLSRLLAVAEAYPELKANTNFIQLQDELAGTENRLATARKDYNDAVRNYNVKVKSVPTNFFAGLFSFSPRDAYEIDATARTLPEVNFE